VRNLAKVFWSISQVGWPECGRTSENHRVVEKCSRVLDTKARIIIQRGGTFLGSKRCDEFKQEQAQWKAIQILRQREINSLIVIGGDGSQAGSWALWQKGFPVVGVASTIDNDLCGSEITIGVDSALNVALEAIDRLKVTASSHQRAFLVEMMGRDCRYLALMSGIAGGAECSVLPDVETDPHVLACELRAAYTRGKCHAIVVRGRRPLQRRRAF
jgi:6-phosphofructokinase 1